MSYLRLLYLLVFVFNFSGKPVPAELPALKTVRAGIINPDMRVEDETFIPWLPERKLTWDDFLSEPQKNSDAVASTNTALGITYKVKGEAFSYQISCNFTKPKSWGVLKTDYILAHEQAHFDITELFARRLHQRLQAYRFDQRSYKKQVAEIYQQIIKEKEAMQEAYDDATDHSRNKKMQSQWLEAIEEMLKDSEPFADYP